MYPDCSGVLFCEEKKEMKKKRYYMICLIIAIFFLMLFRDVRREYQNLRKGMEQQSVILLDVHPDAKNISKLKKYKGVQTAALLYRLQAETADGKVNFQVLGSEELPGTDRQKEDIEDMILLPEKLEQELGESDVNRRRFLFESITGRKQMYQFSACEWTKGEYAIISWSMAEKIIRELDTESRQPDGIYLVADSTEGLKNIKSIMKEFSDTANVDIDGMIQKSETREKKMQKLLEKALFDVLFLQIVIYLTGRNAEKDFFRTEGTVLLMIIMLVIVNALKII